MPQRLTDMAVELVRVLAELDQQELHLPAIHVARAIEAIESAIEEATVVGLSPGVENRSEVGATLN